MKIRLVFEEWRSQYHGRLQPLAEVADLGLGDFHSGSTFEATIEVDADAERELEEAMSIGYRPVFYAKASKP